MIELPLIRLIVPDQVPAAEIAVLVLPLACCLLWQAWQAATV